MPSMRQIPVLIGALALLLALCRNIGVLRRLTGRGIDSGTGGSARGIDDSYDAMTKKVLAQRARKKSEFVRQQRQRQRQRQGEEGRRRRQRDQNNNMTWRQGEAAHFDTEEEEEEEEVPPNTTSYLGFDGVPFGSCYEPHPYFRPNPRTAQITLPIVNLGFPKAGTTSFQNFLACAGSYNISHQFCAYLPKVKNIAEKKGDYCGRCLSQAATNATFAAGIDNPLYRCGNYDAFTQIDMSGGQRTDCYWPQVDMLDDIHRASPDATFVFTMRAFDKWYTSLTNWHEYHMRIADCRLGAYPDGVLAGVNPRKYEEWRVRKALRTFYCDQVKRVREFVLRHPSHNLVEIMVGDPDIGNYLAELFGINVTCWGIHNVNPRSETLASIRNTTNMTVKVARAPPKKKKVRKNPKNSTSVLLWRKMKAQKRAQEKRLKDQGISRQ
mmetsp:Transcript_13097/g.27718  ORF Transcript_13097/g.27718 Transcript_13097/m.27718 type:complete len:438 (+) Transcript_13097:127-1440(+)